MCFFCGEEITIIEPYKSKSLLFHSLDGNHNNWDPANKVSAHFGCHSNYHNMGDKNVMKRPEVKIKQLASVRTTKMRKHRSERMIGDKNPMKRSEVAKKVGDANRGNSQIGIKGWDTRRRRYGQTGYKDPEAFSLTIRESWNKAGEKARARRGAKVGKTLREKYKYEDHPNKGNSQIGIKGAQTKRERYTPEEISEIYERALITRRDRYGPSGRRPKEDVL